MGRRRYVEILCAIAAAGCELDIPSDLNIPYKVPRETIDTEPDNSIAVDAMAMHALPALADPEDAEAIAIIIPIDAGISVTVGLPRDAILRALTQYSVAGGAESNDADGTVATACHAWPALAMPEDTEAFAIVVPIDASVAVTVGLPRDAILRALTQYSVGGGAESNDADGAVATA